MRNAPPNTDALQALLQRMFPGTHISDTGVALLAAQIAELEDWRETRPGPVEHRTPTMDSRLSTAWTNQQ